MLDLEKLKIQDPEAIADTLEGECVDRETMGYARPVSQEELVKLKDDLCQVYIRLTQLEAEFEKVKEDYKAKMKPLKAKIALTAECIKNQAIYVEDEVFVIPDQKAMQMLYVDKTGYLINTREFTPEERKQVKLRMNK